jgi:RNA polymerase sigma factor (sigma-70 family)
MNENPIVKQLHGIAARLTGDPNLQKDLMQEMFVHFVRVQTYEPGQTPGWYLKSCEFHARNYLKLGRSIDSPRRARNGVSYDAAPRGHDDEPRGGGVPSSPLVSQIEIQGELITNDILNLILPHLSDRQQQVLFLLMKGCGVREAARELGVTHPAVIKHRKRIARIARELLQESKGIGVAAAIRNGTGNNGGGDSNGKGNHNGTGHGSETGNVDGEAYTA